MEWRNRSFCVNEKRSRYKELIIPYARVPDGKSISITETELRTAL